MCFYTLGFEFGDGARKDADFAEKLESLMRYGVIGLLERLNAVFEQMLITSV